jgi:hypothetical protein
MSNPTVTYCIFSGNSAGGVTGGGGMFNADCSPVVADCVFNGNYAENGGGMYNRKAGLILINCTFSKNTGSWRGGGMFLCEKSSPTVTNTVLWENNATKGREIWMGLEWPGGKPSTLAIRYSDVKGGKASVYIEQGSTLDWGAGMIDSDPLFVDEVNSDFHLTFNSPCRGSGDNSAVLDLHDFEGDPRIAYGTVDMGADEFHTHLYWTGDAAPGGNVEIKLVGLPGTSPVGLCIGTGVLDPAIPSMWGDWYLQFPIIGPVDLGSITSPEGVLIVPDVIPATPPPPYSLPMQALIGAELSNLCVLMVE